MTTDDTSPAPQRDTESEAERRAWVLTNRRNLIEFISGMVIRPVEALTKYYPDPLQLTPGAVPVLTAPVPDELVALAQSSEPEFSHPVLIELPEKHPKRVPAVRLPRPLVLHFRTEREREEVLARSYDNADLTGTQSHVSPHLFTGGASFNPRRGLRRRKPLETGIYERLDRFLGALTVLAMACGTEGQLADAGEVFSRTTLLPGGGEWFTELRDWLLDAPGDSAAESVLFRSAVNVFGRSDPTRAMGRLEVLAAIRQDAELADDGEDQEAHELNRQLDMVEKVFRGEREFESFNEGGSSAVKAILFALLDQRPDQLCSDAARVNATGDVLAGAAVLCGLFQGRRRLALGLRDDRYDAFLADIETRMIIHRLAAPGPLTKAKAALINFVTGLRGRMGRSPGGGSAAR